MALLPRTLTRALAKWFPIKRAHAVGVSGPIPPEPAPDAPTWTIDYDKHGRFVATIDEHDDDPDVGAWKFHGDAPTPDGAVGILRNFFLDQPPAGVTVTASRNADHSLEDVVVHELLSRHGPIYREHLDACRAARTDLESHGTNIEAFLAARAADLNATDPQQIKKSLLEARSSTVDDNDTGCGRTVQWVPTHLVVQTRFKSWGEFEGQRDESSFNIAKGLLDADDLEAFTKELFASDDIRLLQTPAWAGPLYRVGRDGNHRVHTARMLNLPSLAAEVEGGAVPSAWTLWDLLSDYGRYKTTRQDREDLKRKQGALVEGLLRRGVIDGELTTEDGDRVLRCHRLPATWLLRSAEDATQANAVYESRYPGALTKLGIPPEVGTDPEAWTRWLTSA